MKTGQEFRTFAIEELGEEYREFSTPALVALLEQKAKREGWLHNRFTSASYGKDSALPAPHPSE